MSPEAIDGKGYGIPVDVWAMGVTIVECCKGYNPYLQMQKKDELIPMCDKIKGQAFGNPKNVLTGIAKNCRGHDDKEAWKKSHGQAAAEMWVF